MKKNNPIRIKMKTEGNKIQPLSSNHRIGLVVVIVVVILTLVILVMYPVSQKGFAGKATAFPTIYSINLDDDEVHSISFQSHYDSQSIIINNNEYIFSFDGFYDSTLQPKDYVIKTGLVPYVDKVDGIRIKLNGEQRYLSKPGTKTIFHLEDEYSLEVDYLLLNSYNAGITLTAADGSSTSYVSIATIGLQKTLSCEVEGSSSIIYGANALCVDTDGVLNYELCDVDSTPIAYKVDDTTGIPGSYLCTTRASFCKVGTMPSTCPSYVFQKCGSEAVGTTPNDMNFEINSKLLCLPFVVGYSWMECNSNNDGTIASGVFGVLGGVSSDGNYLCTSTADPAAEIWVGCNQPNAANLANVGGTYGSYLCTDKGWLKQASDSIEPSPSPSTVVLGDVTGDNVADTGDAIQILRYAVGLRSFTDGELSSADVTCDGSVDTGDAIQILRFTVGLRGALVCAN